MEPLKKRGQYTKQNSENENKQKNVNQAKVVKKENFSPKLSNTVKPDSTKIIIGLILILIITFVAYSPTFKNKVTNWDDDKYLIENPLIKDFNGETISKMFYSGNDMELFWMGNYHPLTMLTLNLNYQMLDANDIDIKNKTLNPFVFQVTNILLHLLNTLLVFWLVFLLFKNFPIAFISALLFGIHTLHVESVSWIAERKDVLYTAFFLFSLVFYTKYTDNFKIRNIILAFIFFVLSSFSKGQAVSLAVTLVAIDYLKNRNLLEIKLIIEKLIFVAVALIFGFIAIKAQKSGLALQEEDNYGVFKRLIIAAWGFTQYIIKLVAPVNLSAIYPYPDIINRTLPSYFLLGFIPSGLTGFALFYFFKKSKEITFAIAFFVINIALLLQFIPVGSAIMADRYAYIPSIGFFVLIGYFYQKILDSKPQFKIAAISVISIFCIFLTVLTFQRTQVWKDSLTLWNDVVIKSPEAVVAWNNLGSEIDNKSVEAKKNLDYENFKKYKLEAIDNFTKAIEGKPDYEHAYYNRGTAKKDYGELFKDTSFLNSAKDDFDLAIKIDVQFPEAYQNRAIVYDLLGDYPKSMSDYNRAIELKPTSLDFFVNRGVIYGKMGQFENAIKDFDYVINLDPDNSSAISNRGLANDNLGNYEKAIADYNTAISLDPEVASYYYNRGLVKSRLNDYDGAIADMSYVLKLDKKNTEALIRRGSYYLQLKKKDNACNDFQEASNLNNAYAKQLLQTYCLQK